MPVAYGGTDIISYGLPYIISRQRDCVDVKNSTIIAAEGNISNTNMSGIIERPLDEHIRAYIRIPNGYQYKMTSVDRGGEE